MYDVRRKETLVAEKKNVLVVGIDPAIIDFSKPGYPPGMTAEKVFAGIKAAEDELKALGYSPQTCKHDFGETAEAVVLEHLRQRRWDCIMIGVGVRGNPSNFILFEKLINIVHEHAPQARICFNEHPSDIAKAVKRWL
jgi:DNA-binding LacI/PurR family transcriptional regulator